MFRLTIATTFASRSLWQWILRLGAIGFVPLGIADASPFPVPGSMDILLVVLCAHRKELWLYYALAATLGAVIGGFLTYRLARKGGEQALEKTTKPKMLKRIKRWFERSGFAAVAVPALLPPPIPMVPFLMAAGAAQYPVKKFLAALTLGRLARYLILGFLAATYGTQIASWLRQLWHPLPITITVIAMAAAGLWFFLRYQRQHQKRA
jgi:membrane protein DedA with SNARE-associated domain